MTQPVLFSASDGQRKELVTLLVSQLAHSALNSRKTRPAAQVERLANRMLANGYEITRAVWAHLVDGRYEVFAGGTRLEAARLAALPTIPVIVHTGFSEVDIVRLADQDNENDEYHARVPDVDVWQSYKELAKAGWTQDKIALAKGVDRSFVAKRLQLAELPQPILAMFVKNDFLKEGHALEIVKVCNFHNLTPWLTRETIMQEVIDSVLHKTAAPTAKDFQAAVTEYNTFIETAQVFADGLDVTWRAAFVALLTKNKARNLAKVRAAIDTITHRIAAEKRQQEDAARIAQSLAEAARVAAERAERLVTEWESWRERNVKILAGDFRQVGASIPDASVDLIFTDPPYDEKSIPLYGELAQLAARVLKPNGSLIAYVGHYAMPDVLPLMTPHLRYWWLLAVDHAGGAARLPGKWVFVHWKPLLWFVKVGRRPDNAYVADQVNSQQTDKKLHPWQQDTSEATYYIERLTAPGEVVLDPFMGSGTTLLAGLQLDRQVIGIERAEPAIDTTWERIRKYYESLNAH